MFYLNNWLVHEVKFAAGQCHKGQMTRGWRSKHHNINYLFYHEMAQKWDVIHVKVSGSLITILFDQNVTLFCNSFFLNTIGENKYFDKYMSRHVWCIIYWLLSSDMRIIVLFLFVPLQRTGTQLVMTNAAKKFHYKCYWQRYLWRFRNSTEDMQFWNTHGWLSNDKPWNYLGLQFCIFLLRGGQGPLNERWTYVNGPPAQCEIKYKYRRD
jgi:hypothetical protein